MHLLAMSKSPMLAAIGVTKKLILKSELASAARIRSFFFAFVASQLYGIQLL